MPVLHDLVDAHLLDEELPPDREAIAVAGTKPLAEALNRLWRHQLDLQPLTGIAAGSLADRLHVLDGTPFTTLTVGRSRLALSILGLAVVVAVVVWMPVAGGIW